jgi:hypothetical protein
MSLRILGQKACRLISYSDLLEPRCMAVNPWWTSLMSLLRNVGIPCCRLSSGTQTNSSPVWLVW